jgi:cyclic-di-GMP-binding protein
VFGFSKSVKDPLADVKSAERWLAGFPASDPLATHAEVLSELGHIGERTVRRTPAMLEAVFYVDANAARLRATLTSQYIEHASRSTRIENQLWSALFDLTQGFLLAYQAFAREMSDHAQSNKWQALLVELIGRQIMHLRLDAKTRLFRFEQWIPAKWGELHALFALACSRQFERQSVGLAPGESTTTIEHEYLQALLLQLMNSGNLNPRHLEWVAGELAEWCAPLRLTLEPSSVTSFFVDLGARDGLRRRSPAPLEGRVLFLDTRPLHSTLMQNVMMVEQKIRHQPLSERTPRRTEQLNLLHKLAAQVDPEFRPFARRGERTSAVGAVDAIVGFARIAAYLREEARDPMPQIEPGQSFGGTMELAVFGRVRNEDDRRVHLARQRLAKYSPAGGPWDVKDVSQTGFRLVAPMSAANTITLGTLAAIRAHGQPTWTLGIVRRMRRLTSDRAEVGLQVIAIAVHGVDMVEHRRQAGDDYSVDGEPTLSGRTVLGLSLTTRRREGENPVQSVIVPAVEYQPAKRLKLVTAESIHPIRFGRLIEQMADWVWTTIEPINVDSTERAATDTAAPQDPSAASAA